MERERDSVCTHTNATRDDDKLFNKTNSNIIIYIYIYNYILYISLKDSILVTSFLH